MSRLNVTALMFALVSLPASTMAAEISFSTDPFAGSTALTTPGRQVVANELFLPSFDVAQDRFVFDRGVFAIGSGSLVFFNGLAASLPGAGGTNVIVLQDFDNDSNPATPFNAIAAANLIAGQLTVDGAGFFIYFNSTLNVNRLVYSTNLNDTASDMKILARMVSPTGQDAINALPSFVEANFTAVPEPSAAGLLLVAGAAAAAARRWRRSE